MQLGSPNDAATKRRGDDGNRDGISPRRRIFGPFKVIANTSIAIPVHRLRNHNALLSRLLLVLLLLLARGACPTATDSACCDEARHDVASATACCEEDDGACGAESAGAGNVERHRSHGDAPADDTRTASLPCSQGCAWCMSFTPMMEHHTAEMIPHLPTLFAALPVPGITEAHTAGIDHPPC